LKVSYNSKNEPGKSPISNANQGSDHGYEDRNTVDVQMKRYPFDKKPFSHLNQDPYEMGGDKSPFQDRQINAYPNRDNMPLPKPKDNYVVSKDPYKDPYRDPYRDPYANKDPYGRDPYGNNRDPYRDPYARDPYRDPHRDPHRDPYGGRDPYGKDPDVWDPPSPKQGNFGNLSYICEDKYKPQYKPAKKPEPKKVTTQNK